MAEGLARKIFGPKHTIQSAGSGATQVNPYAITVMQEIGIDISSHTSKSVYSLNLSNLDLVITLCAEEVCPVLPGKTKKLHWPIKDPASKGYSEENQLEGFREARDKIQQMLHNFHKEVAPQS